MSTGVDSRARSTASEAIDQIALEMDDKKYQFTISVENEDGVRRGVVEYRGTISWGGQTVLSEPHEEVWSALISSPEFMQIIETNRIESVRCGGNFTEVSVNE